MLKKQTNNLKLKQNSAHKMASVDQMGKITYFINKKDVKRYLRMTPSAAQNVLRII
jgi:hypothetical protein